MKVLQKNLRAKGRSTQKTDEIHLETTNRKGYTHGTVIGLDVDAKKNGSGHLYYGYDGDFAESFGEMTTGELIEVAELMIGKWREVRSRALIAARADETPEPGG